LFSRSVFKHVKQLIYIGVTANTSFLTCSVGQDYNVFAHDIICLLDDNFLQVTNFILFFITASQNLRIGERQIDNVSRLIQQEPAYSILHTLAQLKLCNSHLIRN
jgi:hypothetical protein